MNRQDPSRSIKCPAKHMKPPDSNFDGSPYSLSAPASRQPGVGWRCSPQVPVPVAYAHATVRPGAFAARLGVRTQDSGAGHRPKMRITRPLSPTTAPAFACSQARLIHDGWFDQKLVMRNDCVMMVNGWLVHNDSRNDLLDASVLTSSSSGCSRQPVRMSLLRSVLK